MSSQRRVGKREGGGVHCNRKKKKQMVREEERQPERAREHDSMS